jgi:hypothetical protein
MQVIPETCHVDYNICILKSLVVPYAGYVRNVPCWLQHMYSEILVVPYADYSRNVPCGLQHMYSEVFGRTLCRLCQKRDMWTTTYVIWNLWLYLMQAIPESCHVDYNICILKSLVVTNAGYSRNVPCGPQYMYSEIFGRTLCRLCQKRDMWTTTYVFWNRVILSTN